ncbi:hypothetical protein C8Q74DRAFT_1312763 [Fomes fomentarius]|nr:hypothetical protein C8Q74DRAFT_1312763 [Fomes fomentarius]
MSDARPTAIRRTDLVNEASEDSLQLDKEQLQFFQTATGIEDEAQLKAHIVAVQRDAFKVHPYPCIAYFNFTHLRLSNTHGYEKLLDLGRSRANPVLLEVGTCLGVDLRKAVLDGYPRDSIIATDIVPEFWGLSHKLFNTTQETFPVPFISGNIFDPAFLEPTPPFYVPPSCPKPSKLSDVKTLTELRGHVSAISICAVFHVFKTEDEQLQLARAIASLLSPEPGSMIIGLHSGLRDAGLRMRDAAEVPVYCHSPESWTELWDGQVFGKGTVKVDARLLERPRRHVQGGVISHSSRTILEWTVTRL